MNAGIAGAGIMGQLLAFMLQRSGWQVTLFDHNRPPNCSQVAAGLLTPVTELEKQDPLIFHLGIEALEQIWPQILATLDPPPYFKNKGSLILAHPRDHADFLQFERQIKSKLPPNAQAYFQTISQKIIAELEPELSHHHHAHYCPTEGQIDNQALLNHLETHLKTQGVVYHHNTPILETSAHRLKTQERSHSFDWIFDCRGLGAQEHFPELRSVRGELIWLEAPQVHLSRPIRFLHPRYRLYITPRPDHQYVLGASEIESHDLSPISVRTLLELLTAAYYVHEGFAEARLLKTLTHNRPTLTHHNPQIKYQEGLIALNGLYRHGFLIAPSLMAEVQRFLEGGLSSVNHPHLWESF